jgi:hypothetical protein
LRRLAGGLLIVLIVSAPFWLTPTPGRARGTPANNLLVNGDFENGFTYQTACGGHVGTGWDCFTNDGQTVYGFYDEQWPPVVFKGKHGQLIELNTKNLGVADGDRFAGIYQTVTVEPGAAYVFAMRGMVRTTDNGSGNRDPYRFRVQFGWSFGPTPDWARVQRWVDVGWNTYYDRLKPGRFSGFTAKVLAQEEQMTVYVRIWKKWGDVGEELDVNFDNLSLVGSSVDALVLPTLEPTPRPSEAPPPLLLNGGTPVADLPTPSSVYGTRFIKLPPSPPGTENWPRIYGEHVTWAYPRTWTPTPNQLGGNATVEEYRLGIPDLPYDQIIGFSSVPFGDLKPPEATTQVFQITIGGREGVKWVRQDPNNTYIIYESCTSGLNYEGSFCVRVLVPMSNPMLELQIDRLIETIAFY